MILAVAAVVVAGLLVVLPVAGAGTAAPIALGAGIVAVALVAWSLATGATPPLLMAVLLMLVEFAGSLVFAGARLALVPIAAAGLYLVVELSLRSLELRGRHPGWRSFRVSDAIGVATVTLLVGVMAWLVAIAATGFDLPEGIFIQAVGIAAAAGVIGVIWLLVGRDQPGRE